MSGLVGRGRPGGRRGAPAGERRERGLAGETRERGASGEPSGGSPERAPFLRVTELFHSIQGESTWAGLPCTFVRLTGCPLRCVWCDTDYAFHGGEPVELDELVRQVREIGTPLVEITGGEPLIHKGAFELARRLLDAGFTVLVETSGAVDVSPLDPRVHKIMDLKCPGSGESERNLWSNLEHLTGGDELKFVLADRADYEWARSVIAEQGLEGRLREGSLRAILFSPVWDGPELERLADWILEDRLPVRLQVQLHKLIWGAQTRGV